MAKLKLTPFEFKAKAGTSFKFVSEASVSDSTGTFSLIIPEELEDVARKLLTSHGEVYGVHLDRPREKLRVNGSTLEGCKNFINHVGQDFVSCEVSESLVIVYARHNKVTYLKDRDGKIHPNACDVPDQYKSGEAQWHGTLNGSSNFSDTYQIGFFAKVVKKTVYSRPSGVSFKYSKQSFTGDNPWAEKLNSFIGLSFDVHRMDKMEQMAYSEEAAKFFYSIMHGMCQLADKIDTFFDDKISLQGAIENQSVLLPFKQNE